MFKRFPAWLVAAAALAAPALAADPHGGEKPDLFNADIGNFVFTLIIFGAVIFILGKYAWKPLLNVLNERERSIRESLETARQEREKATALLADYQRQLDRARQEATGLVDEGRRDAEATRQRILDQARKETAELTERGRREIELARDTAVKELYDRAAELSLDLAGRVLGKQLSAADHRALIAESLEQIRGAGIKGLRLRD